MVAGLALNELKHHCHSDEDYANNAAILWARLNILLLSHIKNIDGTVCPIEGIKCSLPITLTMFRKWPIYSQRYYPRVNGHVQTSQTTSCR